MINLVKDTIALTELSDLADWLKTNPRLTKGVLTQQFEQEWSTWLGTKYSVFTNSGSSANLLMLDALINSNRLRSKNVVVPAISWVTTVAPVMQLGLNPILCDADPDNLGLNIDHFEQLLKKHEIGAVIIVHVLGIPNHMDRILDLCKKYDVILLEDCCEAHGARFNNKKVGTFGAMSSFSFYYGHHMSTIEGGMVSVNDDELLSIILSIRSHGWARDIPQVMKNKLEKQYNIDEFSSLYTFYYPGYNFRPTEINAFLGISQLKKLDATINKRNQNYLQYFDLLKDKVQCFKNEGTFVSSLAFGMVSDKKAQIVKNLQKNEIECRPLICGSMGQQPFWIKQYGKCSLPVADKVHYQGLYVPNNQDLTTDEIALICDVTIKSL
jgi:CDP-4-dehydro-6-deoxyglucose reductase, E1